VILTMKGAAAAEKRWNTP